MQNKVGHYRIRITLAFFRKKDKNFHCVCQAFPLPFYCLSLHFFFFQYWISGLPGQVSRWTLIWMDHMDKNKHWQHICGQAMSFLSHVRLISSGASHVLGGKCRSSTSWMEAVAQECTFHSALQKWQQILSGGSTTQLAGTAINRWRIRFSPFPPNSFQTSLRQFISHFVCTSLNALDTSVPVFHIHAPSLVQRNPVFQAAQRKKLLRKAKLPRPESSAPGRKQRSPQSNWHCSHCSEHH